MSELIKILVQTASRLISSRSQQTRQLWAYNSFSGDSGAITRMEHANQRNASSLFLTVMLLSNSAVLLSEIQHVVPPGTHIISDAMRSCHRLPELGYDHSFVVHDKEFVSSSDTSIHPTCHGLNYR